MGLSIRQIAGKGVTLQLLWEEYKQAHLDGYQRSQFCQLYRDWAKTVDVSMRQVHVAGEKMFVDYAGQTIPVVDPSTGQTHQAVLFVVVLGSSNYTYAEPSWDQTLESWIGAHVRAFEFFGGVPRVIVPDNLKSGVRQPDYYEKMDGCRRSYFENVESLLFSHYRACRMSSLCGRRSG